MNLSIRKRLLFGLLSLMTIACSITLVKNYFDTRHEIQELFDAQLAQSARVLLELSAHMPPNKVKTSRSISPPKFTNINRKSIFKFG